MAEAPPGRGVSYLVLSDAAITRGLELGGGKGAVVGRARWGDVVEAEAHALTAAGLRRVSTRAPQTGESRVFLIPLSIFLPPSIRFL